LAGRGGIFDQFRALGATLAYFVVFFVKQAVLHLLRQKQGLETQF